MHVRQHAEKPAAAVRPHPVAQGCAGFTFVSAAAGGAATAGTCVEQLFTGTFLIPRWDSCMPEKSQDGARAEWW